MKRECDHIIYWHGGHEAVRVSELKEHMKYNGKLEEWCCGGAYRFKFCPECGNTNPPNEKSGA